MKFGFTPEAEILNARAAMIGFVAAVGSYLQQGKSSLAFGERVLLIAASLIGGFIFASLLTEDAHDDDDDQGGGMMIPSVIPSGGLTPLFSCVRVGHPTRETHVHCFHACSTSSGQVGMQRLHVTREVCVEGSADENRHHRQVCTRNHSG